MKKLLLATSLAAILAVSMIVTPAASASWVTTTDPSDFNTNNNFDIRTVGITSDGNVRLTVDGRAGATTPSGADQADLVYAYVFVTDVGIVAVTSHQAEDSEQVDDDISWHAHRVTLDDNFCVTSIEDFGKAIANSKQVQVLQTGATEVMGALTVELTIEEEPFSVCVSDVWDLAPDDLLG